MARWDEILSLPVQNPPTLEFSAADLAWSKIEGWRDNMDRLARIPFSRVEDFVRGESANKECPTRFHVEARRRRKASYKQKVDGILDYILYWCSFGPDDHRHGGAARPSRCNYLAKKKKSAGRPNTKRGCTCHFIVKRLIAEPTVALVIYNEDRHVDKQGLPCHGPQDKEAEGTRAMYAPYISDELRLRVLALLRVGVSVEAIMQRHAESVDKQGGPSNRDHLLTHRYVRRQERHIRRSTFQLHPDHELSLRMWLQNHRSSVFIYHDFSDSDPFVCGIQTEWQLLQMIKFGNCRLLASRARFGTHKFNYPVHTVVVFNSDNRAIPVAWVITPRLANGDTYRWMRALHNRVLEKDPTWKVAGFIVDDPLVDVCSIRDVFQCSVLVSFWRVHHLWHKNMIKKCPESQRVFVAGKLAELEDSVCKGTGNEEALGRFVEEIAECSRFCEYMTAVWRPRMGEWGKTMRSLPQAGLESNVAMEFYHNQLKVRLMNEKDEQVYMRVDWLVHQLGTQVEAYFWLDEYPEKQFYARYWKDEWTCGLTPWLQASNITDESVSFQGSIATVVDQSEQHRVRNPGCVFGLCDCSPSGVGFFCAHVLKLVKKPSAQLSHFKQALLQILDAPVHDSLVRDYAMSLAASMQEHLNKSRMGSQLSHTFMSLEHELHV